MALHRKMSYCKVRAHTLSSAHDITSKDVLEMRGSSKDCSACMSICHSLTMAVWVFQPLQLTTPLCKHSAGTRASTVITTSSHGASVT